MSLFKRKKDKEHELRQFLSEFNRSLMLIVDKQLLINNFLAKIKEVFPVTIIHLFLLDENTGKYKLYTHDLKTNHSLNEKGKLINWLSINEKELIVSKNHHIVHYLSEEEQKIVEHLKTELIYPLKVMNHIRGTIFLGKKQDQTPFTDEEINFLSILFDQAAFAIEHSSLYELQTNRIRRMHRTDRLATLGELAAGAAHEIRNPLTTIRSTIQYLSKDFKEDHLKSQMISEVIIEVERINKILQGLLSFARPSELNTTKIDLEELLNQTLLLIQSSLKKQSIQVKLVNHTKNSLISGDKEQLKQAFLNIILNAAEAMSQNPSDRPRLLCITIEKGMAIDIHNHYLLLSFEDTGNGIAEENLENIFNPFFTTKEEGTGLGLAISYGIINRHNGEIEAKSIPGEGTKFTLKLPQNI